MTEPSTPTSETHPLSETQIIHGAIEGFSDEAIGAFNQALDRYFDDLRSRARNYTEKELVLRSDVDLAIQHLRPTSTREATKITADWTKRSGFLFIGFAVGEFSAIKNEKSIDLGSVWWLVAWAMLATAAVVAGVCLDRGLAGTVGRKFARAKPAE